MTARPAGRLRRAAVRCARVAAFLGHYGVQFLHANVTVAREIVTPGSGLAPAVVEMRLRCRTTAETTVLAHLITLTPGTLVLEVRTQPPTLFVHGMHAADADRFLGELGDLEDRLLTALRPPDSPAARGTRRQEGKP
ncbi:Na+/H+ antiporter subunit E [Streptomyces nanhaiensis]|uniref:Na+/H+ antiporter subunit E n=1 Tax=Streptomyces nanhaiensis TaxID=679319 RepID=UPI00399C4BB4